MAILTHILAAVMGGCIGVAVMCIFRVGGGSDEH